MKKLIIALVAGVAVFGAVFASAATLNLNTDDLGAGSHVVAACDTDGVSVSYQTEYRDEVDEPVAGYYVTSVTLKNLNETTCAGQQMTATLSGDPDSGSLTEVTKACCAATPSTTEEQINVTDSVLAEDVTSVHVVITGP